MSRALYAWSWWRIPGDPDSFAHHRRAIHYREHFVTNVATAGGLLFLQKIGAGKYTVDEARARARNATRHDVTRRDVTSRA